jgi:hypothetical protein
VNRSFCVVRFARSGVDAVMVTEIELRESAVAGAILSYELFAQGVALIEL